jgi:outer membrane protein assembly factor BamB
MGIAPLSFNLYITGTAAGSQPYSTELNFQVPLTTHLGGWPAEVVSSVKCSPLVIQAGAGSRRLVAVEDGGLLHMWNKWGDEVAGFPFSAPGGNIWGSIALGDLDGDGAEEIVFGSRNDTLYALHTDGTLSFKECMGADILATPALADFDGNGGMELVFGTMDSKIHALTAQAKEYSHFPITLGGPVMADAAVADLDGDGILDVVVGASDGLIYAICAQTGEFLPGFPVTTGGAIWSSPVIADLNSDGSYEVIVGSDDKKLYAVRSTGELLFTFQASQAIKSSPAIADLDANNRLDVIFTDNDGNVYVVNHQGYRLSGWPYRSGGFMLSSPIVLDIDDDGALEVVVEAPGLKLIHLEADGTLLFELPIESSGVAISSPMVTDLDCDGDVEVALGVPGGVSVWNYPTPSTVDIPWPMYRGNPRRTGFIGDILTGRPESPVDWTGPTDFALWQNYPNPFNPETTVRYSLPWESQVRLSIFNVLGQEVVSLAEGRQAAGLHVATWDGLDAIGKPAASGLYFCRLQAGNFVETRKMVLLR